MPDPQTTTLELRRFGLRSAVECFLLLGAVGGFVVGLSVTVPTVGPVLLAWLFDSAANEGEAQAALVAILILPCVYALFGASLGAFEGLAYNLLAPRIGGLILDIEMEAPPTAEET